MFLHDLSTARLKGRSLTMSWWAVHVESLTPVRIHIRGDCAGFAWCPAQPGPLALVSHPDAETNLSALEAALAGELPSVRLVRSRTLPSRHPENDPALPEHLIVFDINGDHPALWRTADPRVIFPVEVSLVVPECPYERLGAISLSHRSTVELPASGWLYWWDECQDAYEELAPAVIAEADTV